MKLNELSRAQVIQDFQDTLARHVARLCFASGLVIDESHFRDAGYTAGSLLDYARHGLKGESLDWPDDSCALDALQSVCALLYSQAGVPHTFGGGPLDELDSDDPREWGIAGLVVVAAHARYRVETGEAISLAELAALGSLTDRQVRTLASTGEIVAIGKPRRVAAADARRWLQARGAW